MIAKESPQRRALVTGGSRGIGRAVAMALAAAGMRVAVNYARSAQDAAATVSAIRAAGGTAEAIQADVADSAAVNHLFDEIKRLFGGIDVLVNNAAIARDGYLMMLSEPAWDEVMATNLRGPFLCTRQALRSMIRGHWGRIINLVSPAGLLGKDGAANYAASKGGLLSMSKSLAREVARYGITVNAVCPGLIETDMIATLPDEQRRRYVEQIPLQRFGAAEEVAAAVAFLASEQAGYITGSTLTVDGGLMMI
jgi:3-oxoacyl-[acyl-carrier protein] reductase